MQVEAMVRGAEMALLEVAKELLWEENTVATEVYYVKEVEERTRPWAQQEDEEDNWDHDTIDTEIFTDEELLVGKDERSGDEFDIQVKYVEDGIMEEKEEETETLLIGQDELPGNDFDVRVKCVEEIDQVSDPDKFFSVKEEQTFHEFTRSTSLSSPETILPTSIDPSVVPMFVPLADPDVFLAVFVEKIRCLLFESQWDPHDSRMEVMDPSSLPIPGFLQFDERTSFTTFSLELQRLMNEPRDDWNHYAFASHHQLFMLAAQLLVPINSIFYLKNNRKQDPTRPYSKTMVLKMLTCKLIDVFTLMAIELPIGLLLHSFGSLLELVNPLSKKVMLLYDGKEDLNMIATLTQDRVKHMIITLLLMQWKYLISKNKQVYSLLLAKYEFQAIGLLEMYFPIITMVPKTKHCILRYLELLILVFRSSKIEIPVSILRVFSLLFHCTAVPMTRDNSLSWFMARIDAIVPILYQEEEKEKVEEVPNCKKQSKKRSRVDN
jgi:hypothetical protein